MIDGIIKADGTSRLMRATLPATYDEFREQCLAGVQPLDILFNAIGWSQMPTFLNKTNLAKDATAAMFGQDTSAVPDDLFAFIGQYNQHWWSVLHGEAGTGYEEKRTNISSSLHLTRTETRSISYSSKINIDQKTGAVSLVNPSSITISYTRDYYNAGEQAANLAALAPVYVTNVADNPSGIYYLPVGTHANLGGAIYRIGDPDSGYNIGFSADATIKAQLVTGQIFNIPAGETTYEHSTDRNAYPDSGTVDGLTYQYLGIPFQKFPTVPQIATGSYTGTASAGSSSASTPNSLTFDFVPKLLFIWGKTYVTLIVLHGVSASYVNSGIANGSGSASALINVKLTDKTVYWYATSSEGQMNYPNTTYYYVAIG